MRWPVFESCAVFESHRGFSHVHHDVRRPPLEPLAEFGDQDVADMRKAGFNLLRLPLSWSGVSPRPGVVDRWHPSDRVWRGRNLSSAVACFEALPGWWARQAAAPCGFP